ncbi:MAG TPA: prolyl oligopeptidase family serine peptidase [Gemmatimonadaceae bacterium]|nr:prolyl oligopeptidase family serine peptidase [Gemmatimonadaceae bacterium]
MLARVTRRLSIIGAPVLFLIVAQSVSAQQPASHPTRQMQPADLKAWNTIRQSALSNDGRWFAYVLAPNEGDASVIVRSTAADGKEMKFPIGNASGGAGGRGGPGGFGGGASALAISGDSKWVAFTIYPKAPPANGRGAGRGGRGAGAPNGGAPAQNKLGLVNLATGAELEFDRVRRFAFNGDTPNWIAMQSYPEQPSGDAANGARGAAPAAAAGSRAAGTDLLLYNLANTSMVNVGNVAEFDFDDSGEWLAYTIDARDEIGNGVQLRNMKTDVVRPLDSERALYRRLVWADSAPALAVLRGVPDSVLHDTLYSVVSVRNVASASPDKIVFDPKQHADFTPGMAISANRAPQFSHDLATVFFGIRAMKTPEMVAAGRGSSIIQAGAPGMGGTINQPRVNESQEQNPSLIIWHYKDPRLQSQQIVQESQDKAYSYLSEYRLDDHKFVRLGDDALRTVNLIGREHYAYGLDTRAYDNQESYSGRRFEDVYSVDLATGARKLLLSKHLASAAIPSPSGKELLYWDDAAQWAVMDVVSGDKHEISKGVPTVFADTSDDHNNLVTPPDAVFGWTKDGSAVLVSDAFDVWKVPVRGGVATNLTVDGKRDQIRYQRLYPFGQDTRAGAGGGRGGRGGAAFGDGIDTSKPLYFGTYGEWTKKEGIARVNPGRPGAQRLVFDDAKYSFEKAKDADVYVYTRQTAVDFPDYYVASADLKSGRRITDANPQQKDFAWTSGVRLIDYTSAKGDKLQGALYLPANYEPGKKYPLLVTIYEKRSNLAHAYVTPNETSTPNRSIYTSRGYAVLDPDIKYRVNDPGMSAVWCVIPAVKAAIATSMIDSTNVGLWGHSWGGYQTAFLVTQTHIFKAAIAGAPLTDMVSMYGSIYWNSGGADQAIFESSQGRFKGNYIDNYDAYIRNSPNFHAKNVTTPLIILSDDKDGAVDFNQGVTYFNTLRQLGKKVILLTYVGENHGLARPINQKDYAMRQKDWFDHYLLGKPAPDWMTNGIPRIKMDEYWQQLKAQQAGSIVP